MFSFYIPTAALNEQKKTLELLGENIANLNTPGYKTRRITFVETLGTVAGVSQLMFKQGAVTYTGNVTDLAIKGDSFFIVKKGEEKFYTRAGAFSVDSSGKLVNVDGYVVQGWMEDIRGGSEAEATSTITDIVIDPDLIMPAKATENVWLAGNLNAGLESTREVWATGSAFTKKATLVSSGITFPLNVTAGVNDQFKITFDPQFGETITEELTLTAGTYNDIDSLVAEINNQINASGLKGKVEVVNAGGSLKFRAIDGYSGTTLTLSSGTNDVLSDLGFVDGVSSTSGDLADESTELNDLLQVTTSLVTGDSFNIVGKNRDGESVSGAFTYTDGATLGDLVDTINNIYSGYSTAKLENGKVVLEDDEVGDSSTTISLSASDGNTGLMSVPSFVNTESGYTARVSTSMVVYDSLGESHNLTINFTKTENTGEWNWEIVASSGETIVKGGSGKVLFDSNGSLMSFIYDGGVDALTLSLSNGAEDLVIRLHADEQEGITAGITQFNAVSTLHTKHQDGKESGTLNDFKIRSDGAIIGYFTNGEEAKLAQIALAEFANPSGLKRVGGSNFISTGESGVPNIGKAESLGSTIESGSLELSTVDLADQFTKMIEAQRAYQAAARVISTLEQIADETTRLKR
ncbi:MAG: flagellar hook-basal body complex protein [Candidatus Marinimicrobia bacterium]|nr:flagellar hook-basal body complex protein [Candidatus Neomarinimicrobiota bacterium]